MPMMKMKNNFVLLKEESLDKITDAGILLPSDRWKRRCRVLAAGPESSVRAGNLVLRNVGKGTDIEINGQMLEIVHEDWIIAVLNE